MKRFTETTKWDDKWFRALSPAAKLLFLWMVDKCDGAGVIDPDYELAAFQIGTKITEETLAELEGRVVTLENRKLCVTKFVLFQHGELSRDCKAHNAVFKSLEANGLLTVDEEGKERVSIPIGYPLDTPQVKGKVKGKETVKSGESAERGEKEHPGFDDFWQAYPKKVGRPNAIKAWNRLKPNLQIVLAALEWQNKQAGWLKGNGEYIPHPASYLNSERYNDEQPKPQSSGPRFIAPQ